MTRHQLVEWIVNWRQKRGGSISPDNHRRLLKTRTTAELELIFKRINAQEEASDSP